MVFRAGRKCHREAPRSPRPSFRRQVEMGCRGRPTPTLSEACRATVGRSQSSSLVLSLIRGQVGVERSTTELQLKKIRDEVLGKIGDELKKEDIAAIIRQTVQKFVQEAISQISNTGGNQINAVVRAMAL